MSLRTAIHSLVVERKLPYSVQQYIDREREKRGHTEKTVRTHGFRLRVRLAKPGYEFGMSTDELFIHNILESREYLQHVSVTPASTVVDVGGNIGIFALQMSRLAKRVISVEPDAGNLALLRQNVARNATNVTIIAAALAKQSGMIPLYDGGQGGYHTTRAEQGGFNWRAHDTVRAMTLTEIFEAHQVERCDLLKMDCEGAEFETLPDLPSDMWSRIDQLAMEYHRGDVQPILDCLAREGLTISSHTTFNGGGHVFASRR
jgi:FkbM family methyltransferase